MNALSPEDRAGDPPKTVLHRCRFWYYAENPDPDGTAVCRETSRRMPPLSPIMGR